LDKASKKSKGPVDPTKKKGAKKGGQAASGGMPQPVYPGNTLPNGMPLPQTATP